MRSYKWSSVFNKITVAAGIMLCCTSFHASAVVNAEKTRVVFNSGSIAESLSLVNSEKEPVVVQVWTDNGDPTVSPDKVHTPIVINPPVFKMKPAEIRNIRLLLVSAGNLPQDRESLFWMNVKAIPSMDKSKLSDNTLQLAIISRIKLYYRPAKLTLPPDQAADKLTFSRNGSSLTLTNPTPYYLTVTELNAGTRILENALVPPMGKTSVKLPADAGNTITYRTINDYGALTPKMNGVLR